MTLLITCVCHPFGYDLFLCVHKSSTDVTPNPLTYTDNKHAKQLLYAIDDHVWCMKITALEEYADFATLDRKIV
jgi:hypothetical protein